MISRLPHHNRNAKISGRPTCGVGRRTESSTDKILNRLILRGRQDDADSELILNILPITTDCRQTIGSDGATAIGNRVLQDKLPNIATASGVMLAAASTNERQAAKSERDENAHRA
jgi:hypothetical protein